MQVRIKNLRLRTIIGVYEWEQTRRQDVVINVVFDFDGRAAATSDRLEDTVDYKTLTRVITEAVEASRFVLLEKLADTVLQLVLADPKILAATVEVDKPGALRYADSVSVVVSGSKERTHQ